MRNLETYIQEVLGYLPVVVPLDKPFQKKLPLYISVAYNAGTINVLGRDICLLMSEKENEFTPEQLARQKLIAEQALGMPVVFIFNKIASYNMKRYIERKINFIVPQKQLFIPDLMMDIRKIAQRVASEPKELGPMAQLVLFYHLQRETLNGKTIKHVAEKLGGSYLHANRAINNLRIFGLCDLQGGKEKVLLFDENKKALWNKALPYLINPIQKTVYTDSELNTILSGMNAMAYYTMLNDERRKYYAISKEAFRKIDVVTDTQYGENKMEVWRYDPTLIAENGYIDRLSLYMLYKESNDERIETALDTLIEQLGW
ncbi:MAG: hypothetical protein PHS30_00895 [Bacteroidales bacterium]|nr:hypothetical protein [Bacteroidales bacterium]